MKKLSIQEMRNCVGGIGLTKQIAVAPKTISFKIIVPARNTVKANSLAAIRF